MFQAYIISCPRHSIIHFFSRIPSFLLVENISRSKSGHQEWLLLTVLMSSLLYPFNGQSKETLCINIYFRFHLELISNSQKARKNKILNTIYTSPKFIIVTLSCCIICILSIHVCIYKFSSFELYEGKLYIWWLFTPIYSNEYFLRNKYFLRHKHILCHHNIVVYFINLHGYNTNLPSISLVKWSNNVLNSHFPSPVEDTAKEQVLPLIIISLHSLQHFNHFMTLTFLNLLWHWLLKRKKPEHSSWLCITARMLQK